jgi:hypothetical protein
MEENGRKGDCKSGKDRFPEDTSWKPYAPEGAKGNKFLCVK